MAQKRMFDKTITNSDSFLELPDSSQVLYFHLSMNADDDGFINNWKSILRMTGTKEDDLKILISKQFVIPFESGVIVIKHWRINNFLRKDRHVATKCQKEASLINVGESGEYTLDGEYTTNLIDLCEENIKYDDDYRKKAYEESTLPYSFEYKIKEAFKDKECPICGFKMSNCENSVHKPTIQHNIPLSKGGKHELGNISVICQKCNISIRDKETGKLNAKEVINEWDKISGQPYIGQPSIDKNRIDKNRIDNNIYSREESKNDLTIKLIIDYLNSKAMTNYRATSQTTKKHINARLKEGFKFDDFVTVIDNKTKEWMKTDMEKYLRPETLFGTKFESYLNQKDSSKPEWFDKKYERVAMTNEEQNHMDQIMEKYK